MHADKARSAGKNRADQEADGHFQAEQEEQDDKYNDPDQTNGQILPVQIGGCPLLNGGCNLLHLFGTGIT